jgi:hypothetical protein
MMQTQTNSVHSKLRLSGGLIAVGLLIEALSLLWNHPLSFIAFVVVGGALMALGMVVYLFTLVNIPNAQANDMDGSKKTETQLR